jgi:response regulator RpfG family c-di-GMP phosphodiesterase
MSKKQIKILVVDDELPIVHSIQRVLRKIECSVQTACDYDSAIDRLSNNVIDIVISDVRMPGKTGIDLFKTMNNKWPSIERILMTGFFDIHDIVDAINNGHIYSYISKPWKEEDFLQTIQQSIAKVHIKKRNDFLEQELINNNNKLSTLNNLLEQKVEERTNDLKLSVKQLEEANENLKSSYSNTLELFSNLLLLRFGTDSKQRYNVARLAQTIASIMKLTAKQSKNIYYAALLADIGKLGLKDDCFSISFEQLSKVKQKEYQLYPLIADATLSSIEPLGEIAKIIAEHREYADGSGFPKGLIAEEISIEAQILSAAFDYYSLIHSNNSSIDDAKNIQHVFSEKHTKEIIDVIDYLIQNNEIKVDDSDESMIRINVNTLKPGMKILEDLKSSSGLLLLAKNTIIQESMIDRVIGLAHTLEEDWFAIIRKPDIYQQ